MANAQYYTRYRHSPKLITPIQSIPTIKTIEELKPQEGIQRYYPYQGLDDKRRMYNRAKQDEQLKTKMYPLYSFRIWFCCFLPILTSSNHHQKL